MRRNLIVALAMLLVACSAPTPITPTQSSPILIAQPSSTSAPEPTDTPISTPTPTTYAPSGSPRAILVSIDGGGSLSEWIERGNMPTLSALRDAGASRVLQGVDPTTNAVSHVSLATGMTPTHTGITGERVHLPIDGLYWYTSAFEMPFEAKPIWQRAQEEGLITAALFWPGAEPTLSNPLADYTVGYAARDAYSKLHTLTLYPAVSWIDPPESFSPPQEASFEIRGDRVILATMFLLVLDSTDDSAVNYDTFVLSSSDRAIGDGDITFHAGEWGHWSMAAGQGADFFATNPSPDEFALFQSGVNHVIAAPEDFQQALIDQFGYFPPPADYYALEHNWINADQYMDMARRQSDWMMAVTAWVYASYQPDLLLTVQSPLDQAGHQFAVDDPYHREAAAQVDKALADLLSVAGEDINSHRTALFLTSPYGNAPIQKQINLNTVLEQAGLLRLGRRGFVIVEQSQAIAFASGGSAHIYINLAGREKIGIVQEESYTALQDQIVDLLQNLTDPDSGELVFARVLRREELGTLGMDGAYAGDIFVQAVPGYTIEDFRGLEDVFQPVTYYGQHGYAANHPMMAGSLIAVGRGIQPGGDDGLYHLIDIAATIAQLLGLDASGMDGDILAGLLIP